MSEVKLDGDRCDPLGEWLALGRNVLARYYPGAEYGLLLIHIKEGVPDVQLPLTLPRPAADSSPPCFERA